MLIRRLAVATTLLITFLTLPSLNLFAQNSGSAFPLSINNKWYIELFDWNGTISTRDTIVVSIPSSSVINQKEYFRISSPYSFVLYDYLRADSLGVYYYDTEHNREWLLFDATDIDSNTTYTVGEPSGPGGIDTPKVTFLGEYTSALFGQMVTIRSFYWDKLLVGYYISISPQFGFIAKQTSDTWGYYWSDIIGAVINNQNYGTVTSVESEAATAISGLSLQTYISHTQPNELQAVVSFPQASDYSLRLYDITGALVSELATGYLEKGTHTNKYTIPQLSNGVYICVLHTLNARVVSKFLITR